jgi:hypothetical protein
MNINAPAGPSCVPQAAALSWGTTAPPHQDRWRPTALLIRFFLSLPDISPSCTALYRRRGCTMGEDLGLRLCRTC